MARLHQDSGEEEEDYPVLRALLAKTQSSRQEVRGAPTRKQSLLQDGHPAREHSKSTSDKENDSRVPDEAYQPDHDAIQLEKRAPPRLAKIDCVVQPPKHLFPINATEKCGLEVLDRRNECGHFVSKASKKDARATASPFRNPAHPVLIRLDAELDDIASWPPSEGETDLSDFIVDDSASEEELRRPARSVRKTRRLLSRREYEKISSRGGSAVNDEKSRGPDRSMDELLSATRSMAIGGQDQDDELDEEESRDPTGLLMNLPEHIRAFISSPPSTFPLLERPTTPPASPSNPVLRSPAKKASRIPASPCRPSFEAFWSPEEVNNWNDLYSPQATPRTRRHLPMDNYPELETFPSATSAGSLKKEEKARRKAFDSEKVASAHAWLEKLDLSITENGISRATAATGGVKIIWSSRLHSTAGKAHSYRRRDPKTGVQNMYATIELASRILTTDDRLLNTLAHEFAHLCTHIISGVRDRPHGPEFKAWARTISEKYRDEGIQITTRHSYHIDKKYLWRCTNTTCEQEYSRHTRCIDTTKASCGVCRSTLVQIRPKPCAGRSGTSGTSAGTMTYQQYQKDNFKRIQEANPGAKLGEISRILAKGWKSTKEAIGNDNAISKDLPLRPSPSGTPDAAILIDDSPDGVIMVEDDDSGISTIEDDDSSDPAIEEVGTCKPGVKDDDGDIADIWAKGTRAGKVRGEAVEVQCLSDEEGKDPYLLLDDDDSS